jgi:hypothetical protein
MFKENKINVILNNVGKIKMSIYNYGIKYKTT